MVCRRPVIGRIIADRVGATLTYHLADRLGSYVRGIDATGALSAQSTYSPYGNGGPTSGDDKRYTGQQQEPASSLGLYYYKARFYSPVLGTFVSADSVTKDGLNRYAYARWHPVRFTDPTGRTAQGLLGDLSETSDPADIDACARAIVDCLWYSAGGDAQSYIRLTASYWDVPADVLAAIVLNEALSRNRLDRIADYVGDVGAWWGIDKLANRSFGIAQMKLLTARFVEKVTREFQDLAHDSTLIIRRLRDPRWGIAYAAALMSYYRDNVFEYGPVRDSDYIVSYRGTVGYQEWLKSGGCDECGDVSPGQIAKVRALEPNAVVDLAAMVTQEVQ